MKEEKNICPRCGYDYPEHVGLSHVAGTMSTREPVCGICALYARTSFNEEMAEGYRLAAIEARENGEANPPMLRTSWLILLKKLNLLRKKRYDSNTCKE